MKSHINRIIKNKPIRLSAVLALLGLLWSCYPVAETTYSNPQEPGTAQWLIEFRTGEAKVHIEMRYSRKSEKGSGYSSHGFTIDPALLSGDRKSVV